MGVWTALLAGALLAAGATTLEAVHDPLGECIVRGGELPGAEAYAGVVDSDLGRFPLGVTCTYATGDGAIVHGPGWSRTLFVVLAPLAALAGLVRAVRRASPAGRR